tara:strand:+ start:1477 stop:2208 length:732 start_codon:yes stop_codon:yes gene_type:complete
MKQIRLDKLLLEKKLVKNINEVSNLINEKKIRIPNFNSKLLFEHTLVRIDSNIKIIDKKFVSRGGEKLDRFIADTDITIDQKVCLDVGASTGGFTDALLKRGAKKVYCIDVGKSELNYKIRNDKKVKFFENINAKYNFDLGLGKLDIIAVDVSFISVVKITPQLINYLHANSILIVLIKPQFEAKKNQIDKGGILTNNFLVPEIIDNVIKNIEKNNLSLVVLKKSEIKGRKGNQEFFAMFKLS